MGGFFNTYPLGCSIADLMNIYLSPHHDDVCFSIGWLAATRGGELVNLFTDSVHGLNPSAADAARHSGETNSARRRREDARFTEAVGLGTHDLDLPDVADGADPFDLTAIDDEIERLGARLVPYLLDLLPQDSTPASATLYCPMGVGAHRNHLSAFWAVRRAYDRLSPRCSVQLYEELPYASIGWIRQRDVAAMRNALAGHGLVPMQVPLTPAELQKKLEWISYYESQHHTPPRPEQFIPASGDCAGPHELVWRLLPMQTNAASTGHMAGGVISGARWSSGNVAYPRQAALRIG